MKGITTLCASLLAANAYAESLPPVALILTAAVDTVPTVFHQQKHLAAYDRMHVISQTTRTEQDFIDVIRNAAKEYTIEHLIIRAHGSALTMNLGAPMASNYFNDATHIDVSDALELSELAQYLDGTNVTLESCDVYATTTGIAATLAYVWPDAQVVAPTDSVQPVLSKVTFADGAYEWSMYNEGGESVARPVIPNGFFTSVAAGENLSDAVSMALADQRITKLDDLMDVVYVHLLLSENQHLSLLRDFEDQRKNKSSVQ